MFVSVSSQRQFGIEAIEITQLPGFFRVFFNTNLNKWFHMENILDSILNVDVGYTCSKYLDYGFIVVA